MIPFSLFAPYALPGGLRTGLTRGVVVVGSAERSCGGRVGLSVSTACAEQGRGRGEQQERTNKVRGQGMQRGVLFSHFCCGIPVACCFPFPFRGPFSRSLFSVLPSLSHPFKNISLSLCGFSPRPSFYQWCCMVFCFSCMCVLYVNLPSPRPPRRVRLLLTTLAAQQFGWGAQNCVVAGGWRGERARRQCGLSLAAPP